MSHNIHALKLHMSGGGRHSVSCRAEEVDLVLELEGQHKKEAKGKMSGKVRVLLKTEDDRDHICISDAIWDPEQMPLTKQVCWP